MDNAGPTRWLPLVRPAGYPLVQQGATLSSATTTIGVFPCWASVNQSVPQQQLVCILFADICNSTPLYEKSGDAFALEIVGARLDELAAAAARHDGKVIRSKGDDVLCVFDVPVNALEAAAAMVEFRGPGVPAIHVGIHFGPVIPARQDIFGDAVNVAARMLALAKPGEIVASKDLVDALPHVARNRLALLGKRMLKGKQEPIEVYSMILDIGDATQALGSSGGQANAQIPQTVMASIEVELEYKGQIIIVRDSEDCLLGRAERCDLVIADPCVSREHARVKVYMGRATLTDQSTTGSWILDSDRTHKTLRREAGVLRGRGAVRLGRHPQDAQPAPELAFKVHEII